MIFLPLETRHCIAYSMMDNQQSGKLPWEHMVASVQDLRAYKAVVLTIFEDGRVNSGRLLVLKQFTDDVCDQVQDSSAIRHYYEHTMLPMIGDLYRTRIRRKVAQLAMFGILVCLTLVI